MSNSSKVNAAKTQSMQDLKVGIVDDSPLIRALINEAIKNTPGMRVVGEAEDPLLAREMIKDTNPDVITLDVEMPRMNGIEFLEKLMRLRPMPVIMVSTLTQKGADITLQALELGAVDYIGKPENQTNTAELLEKFNKDLIEKLQQIKHIKSNAFNQLSHQKETISKASATNNIYDIITIASSTGGIERLRYLFSHLKVNIPPIVVVQHINQRYVPNLVTRIQKIVPEHIKVALGENQKFLEPNTIYFADNVEHLTLKKITGKYQIHALDKPARNGFIASADYMFLSLARIKDARALGVVLSGMGHDGAEGLLELKHSGATTIGEDEESCLVYGMSHAAAQRGALTQETSIQSISKILNTEKKVR